LLLEDLFLSFKIQSNFSLISLNCKSLNTKKVSVLIHIIFDAFILCSQFKFDKVLLF